MDLFRAQRRRRNRELDDSRAAAVAFHRVHGDASELAEAALPAGETVSWHGVLLAEAYGPSHISGLLDCLARLGWDQPPDLWPERSLPDWIAGSRARSAGGGFFPLTLQPGRSSSSQSGVFGAPLPAGVQFARGLVLDVTPALTMVVLFFAFDDEQAASVQASLSAVRQTTGRRTERGWVVDTVANQHIETVVRARQALRDLAGGFFDHHLPGGFSSDLDTERPACEVVTTTAFDPHQPEASSGAENGYLRPLGLGDSLHGWESEDLTGWRLELPDAMRRSSSLLLAGNLETVTAPPAQPNPGRPTEQVSDLLFHRMETLFALWAGAELLRGYAALLSSVRDQLLAGAEGSAANIRRLQAVRTRLLGHAADARTLAEELAELAAADDAGGWHAPAQFVPVRPDLWAEPSLAAVLRSQISRQARAVSDGERRLRADLAADSEAVGAIANLRAQRNVALMTALIGIVSTVLVMIQILRA